MSAHAKLSPSSADRWTACPGSVRLCEGITSEASEYAAEGSAAHWLAEQILTGKAEGPELVGGEYIDQAGGYKIPITEEMLGHVRTYVDYVNQLSTDIDAVPMARVEARVSLGFIYPDTFGTVDYAVVTGSTLHVVDLKYGRGVEVEAKENKQALLYALGMLREVEYLYDVETVVIHIHQPRKGGPAHWELSADELRRREDYFREAAERCQQPDAPLVPGPKQCRWCPAAGNCRARAEKNLELVRREFSAEGNPEELKSPELLTLAEIADLLPLFDGVRQWMKSVEDFAEAAALRGEEVPGYKLVATKTKRKYRDEAGLIEFLRKKRKLKKEQVLVTKPIALTKLTKLYASAYGTDKDLAPFIGETESRPVLAPASDPRPPVEVATAADDFGEQ